MSQKEQDLLHAYWRVQSRQSIQRKWQENWKWNVPFFLLDWSWRNSAESCQGLPKNAKLKCTCTVTHWEFLGWFQPWLWLSFSPKGVPWVSKIQKNILQINLLSYCANIHPILKKLRSSTKNQSFLMASGGFLNFTQYWLNISALTQQIYL